MKVPAASCLSRLNEYLSRYAQADQSAAFELLVAAAFREVFHLPLQSADTTENDAAKHRVVWLGRVDKTNKRLLCASSGADSICFGYGFNILIESTRRGNVAAQWRREFVECIRHHDDFVSAKNLSRQDVFLAIVAPEFHRDTYTGFKQKAAEGYNVLMVDCPSLVRLKRICDCVLTVRHLDLRHLMKGIVKKLRESVSLPNFMRDVRRHLDDWELDLLKQEQTVYFGLKSYEAMKKAGRNIVGVSDIMLKLHRDPRFERCIRKLGVGDLTQYIKDGLLKERLARIVEAPSEDLFCRVDGVDFKSRGLRLIRAVESLDQ